MGNICITNYKTLLNEIKEDAFPNGEIYNVHEWKTQYHTDCNFLPSDLNCSAIPIKEPIEYFEEIDELILKFM